MYAPRQYKPKFAPKKVNPYVDDHGYLNFPVSMSAEDVQQRKKMFDLIDGNGNGILSLAEVDGGIRDKLHLDQLFDAKPVLIRAFNAAKAINKSQKEHSEDFIDVKEFRFILIYLMQYFEYYQLFQEIDKSHDRRVSLNEFKFSQHTLERFGVKIDNMEEEFNKIDTNGGGFILFDEFVEYCISRSLSLHQHE